MTSHADSHAGVTSATTNSRGSALQSSGDLPTLMPFQKTAVARIMHMLQSNPARACYNACEQGLGKSIMSIAVANELRAQSILVVGPSVMRMTWEDEVYKWSQLTSTCFVQLTAQRIEQVNLTAGGWVITSYALASELKVLNALCSRQWDLLILDEAHACKNKRSRRTRACLIDLWKHSTYRLLLSGTPCTTSIIDLYTAARKCAPEHFKDFDAFADRYTYKRITPWGCKYFGLKNGEELKAKIRKHFFIRYTKAEVLPELPPKTFQQITLPASLAVIPKTKDEAQKLEDDITAISMVIALGETPHIPKTLAEHRRLQGERKIPAVVEFCENLLEQEIPIVVFGWHRKFIADLCESLQKYSPAIITGDVPPKQRHEAVARFQDGQTLLFLANLAAGGVGITLTRASICVLGELDWAPSTVAQSTDRLHRIGTKNPVTIYYFVVKDSLDEVIANVVIGRAKTISKVVDN